MYKEQFEDSGRNARLAARLRSFGGTPVGALRITQRKFGMPTREPLWSPTNSSHGFRCMIVRRLHSSPTHAHKGQKDMA